VPSRRTLNSVAQDVSQSLVSRNDDLGGYWTLGQLLSHTLRTHNPSYRFDLLRADCSPQLHASGLSQVPPLWSQVFRHNLARQRLSLATVTEALALLDFDLDRTRPATAHPGHEEYPATCRVQIRDDRGVLYSRTADAWCHPHDPTVELRSTRGV
jgi:hypothetical protein